MNCFVAVQVRRPWDDFEDTLNSHLQQKWEEVACIIKNNG
jgi:hypothetical protein